MARQQDLDALDDFLTDVRRLLQRPGYRRRFMAALGEPVSPGTLRVARAVERLQDPFVGDVAEALGVDASTATRLVDRAVKEGYIEKAQDQDDLRRVALRLTTEGGRLLQQATEVRRQLLDEVTSDWSSQDLRSLADLLHRLSDDLRTFES